MLLWVGTLLDSDSKTIIAGVREQSEEKAVLYLNVRGKKY
jgi:hypothetical protein